MNEKLDLIEILKDCPQGAKFYSRCLGSVEFCKITLDNYIEVIGKNGYYIRFKPNGIYQHSEENAEIDLFPSKDQRDWSKWHRPFVDGDVVYAKDDVLSYILIYHKQIDERVYRHACLCLETDMFGCDKDCIFTDEPIDEWRLATEKEKQKLFDAIKANGYKWNAETKTLKELKKEKFDPKTLQPFDKVLVRDGDDNPWGISLFSHLRESEFLRFSCVNSSPWRQCVPYNDDTKHLVGICNKAPEKYINW
jgi:hypothetical protein